MTHAIALEAVQYSRGYLIYSGSHITYMNSKNKSEIKCEMIHKRVQ